MNSLTTTTGTRPGDEAGEDSALLDVEQVAALLRCSTRHVFRLRDAGDMPAPIHLGALVRWDRTVVLRWVREGCPRVGRAASGRGRGGA